MASLGELFVTVGAKIDGFSEAMSTVSQKLDKFDKDAAKATSGFEKFFDRIQGVGTTLTASITAPLAGLGVAVAKVAGDLEQSSVAFTTLLGSAKAAGAYLEQLKAFAAKTPFEFPDLVDASKRMLAMGFSAEQLLPTLRIIGDAISAIGGGSAEIDRVTLALGQMQAKGKVSAQEMNQLAEVGIPAWKLLADAIGKSIPEAMKLAEQGAIQASVAIPAILDGMNKTFAGSMEKQSQTLLGQWSNFKDQITLTLMDLGNVLLPIMKQALQAAMPMLEAIKQLAQAFAQLPAPMQNAILGVTALAAAIGPLLLAVGAMGGAFTSTVAAIGMMSTALGTLATAITATVIPALMQLPAMFANITFALNSGMIGALTVAEKALLAVGTAAMAAAAIFVGWKLGQWAYENIGPLKALGDAIADILLKIPGVEAGINRLTGATSKLKDAGESGDFAIKKLEASLAKHGITVDKTGKSTEEYRKALLDAAKAIGGHEKETTAAQKTTQKFNVSLGDSKKSAEAAEKAQKALAKQTEEFEKATEQARTANLRSDSTWQAIISTVQRVAQRHNELFASVVNLKAQLIEQPAYMGVYNASMEAMAIKLEQAKRQADALAGGIPQMSAAIQGAMQQSQLATDKLGEAFKSLGITSATEYQKVADDAKKAYEAIAGSGIATQYEKDNAMLRMLKAQADAMKANGVQIPKDMEKLMSDLETKVGDKSKGITGAFESLAHSVSQVIGDLSKDLIDSLFEGGGSWAQKGMDALKQLGKAVLSEFVTPATDAIASFIAGALKDLLSGSGFGGLLQSIKDIGSSITGIFKSTPGAPSTPGTSTPGAGASGAAGGGAASWISAISGVVSAVSSVIGIFQNARQEDTLNAIEANTRYSSIHLFYMLEKINAHLPGLDDINKRLNEWTSSGFPEILWQKFDSIGLLAEDIRTGVNACYQELGVMSGLIAENTRLKQTVVIDVDGREIARAVVNYLNEAGATV